MVCPAETPEDAQTRAWFRDAARLLYGSDWQRDTARALGRDEAALACWLVGEGVAEAPPEQLLADMLALMRQRAAKILAAADGLEHRITQRAQAACCARNENGVARGLSR